MAPSFYRTRRAARRAAKKIADNLWAVPNVEVTIQKVDKVLADAEMAAQRDRRAVMLATTDVHLFNADRSGARCGAAFDEKEVKALATEDMFELAQGRKCPDCSASLRR
jgi:hypothetical protein